MARILVADDESTVRHVIRLACERAGHEVHEAIDAPSAVMAYERTQPDLVVLDVNMPGGGASFVLNSLRFGGSRAIAPVVVVSGSLERSAEETERLLRVEKVVLKPFRVHELLTSIADVVAKHPRPASPPPASDAPPSR
jgi:two-component system OmpR family response regulator